MDDEWLPWRVAMDRALYGPAGFFVRERPAAHFRTSVHASPSYARAVAELLRRVDQALGHPDPLDFADVGAGAGELCEGVLAALPADTLRRLRVHAVEKAPRPAGLDPRVTWHATAPPSLRGLLFANEFLDNVPLDVAAPDAHGTPRYLLVHPDGRERLGEPVRGQDAEWLRRWWPLLPEKAGAEGHAPGAAGSGEHAPGRRARPGEPREDRHPTPVSHGPAAADRGDRPQGDRRSASHSHGLGVSPPKAGGGRENPAPVRAGHPRGPEDLAPSPAEGLRAEIGAPRDTAWASTVASLTAGLAVAVDYGHTRGTRPPYGTLTGYRGGRQVPPIPDGSCDLTAHVAMDALPGTLLTQRSALRALGISGQRPPLALASQDPAAYVRALSEASEAAELTDEAGLGRFLWLATPVGPECAHLLR
ncbi:SAM-dependent methyltransferase [Streptomyces sp.]|uniref:SAM-dependent methyltransferase n=1 Tax=Streptomyces sp. TaxID=1931 RepID=UPI002F42E737